MSFYYYYSTFIITPHSDRPVLSTRCCRTVANLDTYRW